MSLQMPTPSDEDFGGIQDQVLVDPVWINAHRNFLRNSFTEAEQVEGHMHPDRIVVAFRNHNDPDSFNDLAGVYNLLDPEADLVLYRCTVDPGKNPMQRISKIGVHKDGVARMKPGVHHNVLGYGYHHNDRRHPALVQRAPIPFERFNPDTQEWYTPEAQQKTLRGFNVHRSFWDRSAKHVGDWSHGCITFANRLAHWEFLTKHAGYPVHGPAAATSHVRNRRLSLALFDITPQPR